MNKNAAPIQSAEQILREARQLQKRKEYEYLIRRAPDLEVWLSYIRFELRFNEIERARSIFERFVDCHPNVIAWIGFAEFELKYGDIARARNCYERAVNYTFEGGVDEEAKELFVAFAEFEEKCNENERARCIYKYALDYIPKGSAEEIYNKFIAFEKRFGDRQAIAYAIYGKRRLE